MSDFFDQLMKEVERREAAARGKPKLSDEEAAKAVRDRMKSIPDDLELQKMAIDRHVAEIEKSRAPAPKPKTFGAWA